MFVCARPVGSEELWQLKYLGFFSRPAIFAPFTCVRAQHNLVLSGSVRGPRNLHLPPIEKSWWAGELEAMAWQLPQESSPFVPFNTWWDTSIEVNNFPMLFFFFFFFWLSKCHSCAVEELMTSRDDLKKVCHLLLNMICIAISIYIRSRKCPVTPVNYQDCSFITACFPSFFLSLLLPSLPQHVSGRMYV